jgi:hypothetical protein
MNLIQQLFGQRHQEVKPSDTKKELDEFDAVQAKQSKASDFEAMRAEHIASYLKCREEGRDDCRIDISWEEMARRE